MPLEQTGAIRPATEAIPGMMDGALFFEILIVFGIIISILIVLLAIVKIWGHPMFVAKSSWTSGDAIIPHYETGKNAILKTATIEGGAFRHRNVADGTLVAIPHGVNNLDGHQYVNSYGLFGMSVPTFLMGGITEIRRKGIHTREELEKYALDNPLRTEENIITDSYNFGDFKNVINKVKEPKYIPLEIEYTSDFVSNINQHYTEAEIREDVAEYQVGQTDDFLKAITGTGVAFVLIAVGVYMMGV